MTKKDLQKFLPRSKQQYITDDVVKFVNAPLDSEVSEAYKQNLVQFLDIFTDPDFKGVTTIGFVKAVLFVTYRLLGSTVRIAWTRVFPERYDRMVLENKTDEQITMAGIQYARGKLVSKLMERSLIPVHILNMDIHQEAINTQAHLMRHAKSENVRMKAAECLIVNLMPPQIQQHKIEVTHQVDALNDLREATRELALAQKKAIQERRADVRQIAESNIINVDFEEISEKVNGHRAENS